MGRRINAIWLSLNHPSSRASGARKRPTRPRFSAQAAFAKANSNRYSPRSSAHQSALRERLNPIARHRHISPDKACPERSLSHRLSQSESPIRSRRSARSPLISPPSKRSCRSNLRSRNPDYLHQSQAISSQKSQLAKVSPIVHPVKTKPVQRAASHLNPAPRRTRPIINAAVQTRGIALAPA